MGQFSVEYIVVALTNDSIVVVGIHFRNSSSLTDCIGTTEILGEHIATALTDPSKLKIKINYSYVVTCTESILTSEIRKYKVESKPG